MDRFGAGTLHAQLLSSQTTGTFQIDAASALGAQLVSMPAGEMVVLTIENEQILLSNFVVSGSIVVCTLTNGQRGYNQTTPATHNVGTVCEIHFTKAHHDAMLTHLNRFDDNGLIVQFASVVPVIVSASQHTITSAIDYSSYFSAGRAYVFKIGSTWYRGVIRSASFGGGVTTINLTGDALAAAGTIASWGFEMTGSIYKGMDYELIKECTNAPVDNPPAGYNWAYSKAGQWFSKDSSGVVRFLTNATVAVSSVAGVLTLDPTAGCVFEVTLTESISAVNMAAGADGQEYILRVKQGAGAWGVAFSASFYFSGNWPSYSPSSVNGTVDYIYFRYNFGTSKYDIVLINKGNAASPVTIVPIVNATTISSIAETDLAAGDAVVASLTTPGDVQRTRWTALGTAGSGVNSGATAGTQGKISGVRDLSSTQKLVWGTDNAATPNLWYQVLTLNRATGVPATTALANLTKTIANDNADNDVDIFGAKAAFVYASSGNVIKAQIGSGMTTSPSFGAEFTVAAANGNGCSVVYINDSNLLFFWHDNATQNLKFFQCTVSGNTITGGVSGNVFVDATAKTGGRCRRFGATNYIYIPYANTGDSILRAMIGLYNGSNGFTSVGASVSTADALNTNATASHEAVSLSDTCLGLAYNFSNTSDKVTTVTRVGTVLTFNASVTATFTSSVANMPQEIIKLNSRCVAIQGLMAGPAVSACVYELKKDESGFISTIAPITSGVGTSIWGYFLYTSPGYALVAAITTSGNPTLPNYFPVSMSSNFGRYCGIVAADVVATAAVSIVAAGSTTAKSGLSAGNRYSLDIGGFIAITDAGLTDPDLQPRAGIAIGAASFVVQP